MHDAGADKKLTAPVDFVSNAVSSSRHHRTARHFANEDAALVPGQLVDVTVQLDDIPGAIVVPRVAVINGPNGTYVYRVNEGVVEMVPVSVQFDNGTDMAVKGESQGRRQCGHRWRPARGARQQGRDPAPGEPAGRRQKRAQGARVARARGGKAS